MKSKSQLRRFSVQRGMKVPQSAEEFADVRQKLAVIEAKIEATEETIRLVEAGKTVLLDDVRAAIDAGAFAPHLMDYYPVTHVFQCRECALTIALRTNDLNGALEEA
jgi:molybdopterin biosynthesis enzyme